MSENNKLIFLDVDATLYSKEQRLVPESAITAIHAAQKNGHKVSPERGTAFRGEFFLALAPKRTKKRFAATLRFAFIALIMRFLIG